MPATELAGERGAGVEVLGHQAAPAETIVPGPHERALGCKSTQDADVLGDGDQFRAGEAKLLFAIGERKRRVLHPKPLPQRGETAAEVLGKDLWTSAKIPMGMGVRGQLDQRAGLDFAKRYSGQAARTDAR